MEANNIIFRCSSLGHLMSNDRSGKDIGDTVKTHLVDVYVSYQYKRKEFIDGKFLEKGNEREEDSITLISLTNKKFYKKNDIRLSNEFITGECDVFIGEDIREAEETIDVKTSWSAHTFFRSKNAKLNKLYKWQGVGYMWLTGAKKHTVSYSLVNGTAEAINDEKRYASYKYGIDYDNSLEYIERCKQIEINHIFDIESFKSENPFFQFHNDVNKWDFDIPREDRVFSVVIERNQADIDELIERIKLCREWMQDNLFNVSGCTK